MRCIAGSAPIAGLVGYRQVSCSHFLLLSELPVAEFYGVVEDEDGIGNALGQHSADRSVLCLLLAQDDSGVRLSKAAQYRIELAVNATLADGTLEHEGPDCRAAISRHLSTRAA